ncbi:MAG: ACP S-malonyltransferase [Gemmatimonadota bacterium]
MVALLFPGQGAQEVGMGQDLAERYPSAREVFDRANEALGVSLSHTMWEGPEEELTATHNAQPAILTHSLAVYAVVAEQLGAVALTAGHSLGEFSAHVAAGTLTFEDAVRAVRRRGELMFRAGQERPGTMAAVIGLDDDVIEGICRDASAADDGACVPANFNSPGQTVISGDVEAVERAVVLAKEAGARRALPLNVSGAFHSPLMEAAEAGLREYLDEVTFSELRVPVVSNVTAEPVSDPAEAQRLLVEQLTSPVRWTASMRTMRERGVQRFVELGPGRVLAGLLRRIDRDAEVESLGTVDQVQAFLEG